MHRSMLHPKTSGRIYYYLVLVSGSTLLSSREQYMYVVRVTEFAEFPNGQTHSKRITQQ